MSAVLADVTPGFRDPVHGAQRTYRALLDAMSRPGLVRHLPPDALDGVSPPSPLGIGAAAVMLTLLDAETSIAMDPVNATATLAGYLRFHTGARVGGPMEDAEFLLASGHALESAWWSRLRIGTDEQPQLGATLIVEVAAIADVAGARTLEGAKRLLLTGPGIASQATLFVGGPPRAFWEWRIAMQSARPRGVDIVLVCGDRIAALPRSTQVRLVEGIS